MDIFLQGLHSFPKYRSNHGSGVLLLVDDNLLFTIYDCCTYHEKEVSEILVVEIQWTVFFSVYAQPEDSTFLIEIWVYCADRSRVKARELLFWAIVTPIMSHG